MKSDPKILQPLNEVLTNELTPINQYFLHAKMFAHWGLAHLAHHERDWLETQLELIDNVGLANYQQSQIDASYSRSQRLSLTCSCGLSAVRCRTRIDEHRIQ